jgi:hypothetical protein
MEEVATLAGFFTAHAIWSVSSGEQLVNIFAHHHSAKGRSMERLALESSVEYGCKQLEENPPAIFARS